MVDAIVVRQDLMQLPFTPGPHNEAVPLLEELLGALGDVHALHDAECLPCCPVGHVDEEVPQFLHAMLFIRSNRPIFWSTIELVNVHLVLLLYPKDKAALALRPELVIDVGNLHVVKFLARLQFGQNLGNS